MGPSAPIRRPESGPFSMDISRSEQRILHLLAQGGAIQPVKDKRGRIVGAECFSREGWRLSAFDLALFRKLKRRRAIASEQSQPYRITRRGLHLVRSEPDNR
jgi:uncharacterized protein YjhX (UPF0386 family)